MNILTEAFKEVLGFDVTIAIITEENNTPAAEPTASVPQQTSLMPPAEEKIDNKYMGYILIADKIKKDSARTIKELKQNNIKETVMLTGDKKEVGNKVAKELKIDKVYTELLPDGKVEKVEELMKEKSEKGKLVLDVYKRQR